MNQDTLSKLTLSELSSLCRTRNIATKSKTTKPAAISKILIYHKRNGYKKLQFEENIDEYRKEELVSEGKAAVGRNLLSKNKHDIVYTIINGHSPSSKSRKKTNIKNTNKKSESKSNRISNVKPRRTKLKKKQEIVIEHLSKIEGIFINIFNSLKDGFKPIGDIRKIKEIMELPKESKDFEQLSDSAIGELEAFSDKMLPLLPLILEAKSLVHDFEEYRQKIKRLIEKQKSRNDKDIYYIGMKHFRRVRDIEQDEIGPFCGIWNNLKQFESWRKDKNVKHYYGKNIERIRHVKDYNDEEEEEDNDDDDDERKKESENEMEMESEHEEEEQDEDEDVSEAEEEEDDDDGSVATEQEKAEEDDLLIPTDEDQDEDQDEYQDEENEDLDDNNHNKKQENEENKEDEENEETEDEDQDDEDDDIDMNKNNKNNKNIITKKTRSRRAAKVSGRKRRRENDDNQDGNDKKRAKLNDTQSVNDKKPAVLSG